MEIAIEPSRLPHSVPLPLFESIYIGSAENNGEAFEVYIGLDEGMTNQLRDFSLDKADISLMENTSDFKRFGEEDYEKWYVQGRVPFALVHRDTGTLAALAWFGPKALGTKSMKHISAEERENAKLADPKDWHTIAFRSYAPYRGTGIMKKFALAVTDVYTHYYPQAKLWTSTSRVNIPSVKLAEKLGYSIDESLSDSETLTMVRS
jgi:RimJ/RimL family protein N-acetyltransferase